MENQPQDMGRFASLIVFAFWPVALAAQTPKVDLHFAQPERPTVATHAGTVATGWLEIEAGAELDHYNDHSHDASAPVVLKFGLAPRLQLSVLADLLSPPHDSEAGVGDVTLGLKWRLTDDAPIIGDFAILPNVKVPSGSTTSGTGTGTTDIGLLLISSHALGDVAMDLNIGYTHRGGNGALAPRNASLWTMSFGGTAAGRIGWVVELYGYPATAGPAGAKSIVAFLAGPTFQVRRWLILDAGGIVPMTGPQPRALYAGVTYNVGRLRN